MSGDVAPREQFVFHFTHVDNLGAIVERGALVCDNEASRQGLVTDVGAADIKQRRRERAVPCGSRGVVADYVPFYFGPRSPMMFRIACEHRDGVAGRYPGGDRPLVYLVARVGVLLDTGSAWVASDGNAASAMTTFTDQERDLEHLVDWPLMAADRWDNVPDDLDRQRRRMAEFLVHREVPLHALHGLATYGQDTQRQVITLLGEHALAGRVIVRPEWYYGYERRRDAWRSVRATC